VSEPNNRSEQASSPQSTQSLSELQRLIDVIAQLRNPDGGCPWDLEQDFRTIAPYTIEEAYEVADAIEREDMTDLRGELGDLLFQVAFHSQLASEASIGFSAKDVAEAISSKMVHRHPHVFKATDDRDAEAQTVAWEEMKAAERARKADQASPAAPPSALDGVALALPALMRAEKLQKRAARVGFDWTEPQDIFEKLDEETAEVRAALVSNDREGIEEEIGDLLFVAANLARPMKVDPEVALRKANAGFERRFQGMEAMARSRGLVFETLSLEEQEALWQAVKLDEKSSSSARQNVKV